MQKVGLVLQGGGMRGIYTAGVLDFFMDQQLYIPYVVAVSAGACNGAAYLARQRGLGKIMLTKYVRDPRYFHVRNLVQKKTLFGMDFIFDEIPNQLEPFDFQQFSQSSERFVVGTTDCVTGESVYYTKTDCDTIFLAIRASCSLPFITPKVKIGERFLLDGSITSPIPIQKSISDGNQRHIVILTAPASPAGFFPNISWFYRCCYPRDHGLVRALSRHVHVLRDTFALVGKLRMEKAVFVIAPSKENSIRNFERNHERLSRYYEKGYEDAQSCFSELQAWLQA